MTDELLTQRRSPGGMAAQDRRLAGAAGITLLAKLTQAMRGDTSMNTKKRLAEMRCKLLDRNLELELSLDTHLRIGRIIQHSAPEQDHDAREAKAAEVLKLLEDCRNEEDVLRKLEAHPEISGGQR